MIAILKIADGRDEVHAQSWESAKINLRLDAYDTHEVFVDDRDHSLGFAGAIQKGWEEIRKLNARWVFHLEMDFLFNRVVPLDQMMAVMQANQHLTQMALKRQPVNASETEAGGIVEMLPDAFTQRYQGGQVWTEHRRFFTTNPSLYPAVLCELGWPDAPESEGHFGLTLADAPEARAAFWGPKFAPPAVEHIGVRAGTGY